MGVFLVGGRDDYEVGSKFLAVGESGRVGKEKCEVCSRRGQKEVECARRLGKKRERIKDKG